MPFFSFRRDGGRPSGEGQIPTWNGVTLPTFIGEANPTEKTAVSAAPADKELATPPLPFPAAQQTGNLSVSSRRGVTVPGKKKRNAFTLHWQKFVRKLGTGTAPSSSSIHGDTAADSGICGTTAGRTERGEDSDELDEVVVDRIWSEDLKTSITHSEQGNTPDKSGSGAIHGTGGNGGTGQNGGWGQSGSSDQDSLMDEGGCWSRWRVLAWIRWHMWGAITEVFSSRFDNEKSEKHYAQENWFIKKSLAMWAALWLVFNWVLACIFAQPVQLAYDKTFYYGIAPVFTLPVVLMVIYDWPRDRPIFYQSFLIPSVWMWAFSQVIFIYLCPYYGPTSHTVFDCQKRDFIAILYYATALQAIALFGLKLDRLPAAIGASFFFIVTCALLAPQKKTWVRTMLNFFFFHAFLIYVHYMREASERRLFTLRDQLKIQYKATQKAQVNERKAADSKRRLTSYVFHEVRVPLNTALLAVQNMGASGGVARDHEVEFSALEGSLSMMSKVLNDVLDFNRMDSGRFESAAKPYGFHQVMRSLFIPLRLATDARGLEFCTKLDWRIDHVARRTYYEAMGEDPVTVTRILENYPDVDGVVVGDESRLRQIITNLASNACKFTPAGGKLSISTQLVYPTWPSDDNEDNIETAFGGDEEDMNEKPPHRSTSPHLLEPTTVPCISRSSTPDPTLEILAKEQVSPLSAKHLSHHNSEAQSPTERIVVRIEVSDTGYGIKPADMTHNKLFSAFNQTEQGRQQGGKGTGLGLALVRQIVKLSGGRLGVRSKVGQGSTFWVELPLIVGKQAVAQDGTLQGLDGKGGPNGVSASILAAQQQRILSASERHRPGAAPLQRDLAANTPTFEDPLKRFTTDSVMIGTSSSSTAVGDSQNGAAEGSQQSSISGRSNAAMHSLMEQGGKVELVLQRHEPSNPALNRSLGDSVGSMSSTQLYRVDENGPSSNGRELTTDENGRPNYVPLPKPPIFTTDGQLTPSPPDSSAGSSSAGASSGLSSSGPSLDAQAPYIPARSNANNSQPSLNIEANMPVLVVDDDSLTRTLMKRMLTRLGCQVQTAENGELALEMILGPHGLPAFTPSTEASGNSRGPILERERKEMEIIPEGKYAVVFLDNQMPVLSGLRTVERLRELGRSDFVVGVTGNALLNDQKEYLEAGVDRVLTKPVLERSLREVLILADEKRRKDKPANNEHNVP